KIELREDLKSRRGFSCEFGNNLSQLWRIDEYNVIKISNKCYDVNLRLTYGNAELIGKAGILYSQAFFTRVNFIESEKSVSGSHREGLIEKVPSWKNTKSNESFNKCIWERIPKTVFVGIEILKFGVMDAVICFNDGFVSRIKVFEALGIKSGYNTERALLIIDNKRIFEAERIVNKVSLEARNKRRSLKRKMDKQNLDEENEYQSGKY
ncbi:uncharacterized protein TNCV_2256171, partial [Trichonephila clavipes]